METNMDVVEGQMTLNLTVYGLNEKDNDFEATFENRFERMVTVECFQGDEYCSYFDIHTNSFTSYSHYMVEFNVYVSSIYQEDVGKLYLRLNKIDLVSLLWRQSSK